MRGAFILLCAAAISCANAGIIVQGGSIVKASANAVSSSSQKSEQSEQSQNSKSSITEATNSAARANTASVTAGALQTGVNDARQQSSNSQFSNTLSSIPVASSAPSVEKNSNSLSSIPTSLNFPGKQVTTTSVSDVLSANSQAAANIKENGQFSKSMLSSTAKNHENLTTKNKDKKNTKNWRPLSQLASSLRGWRYSVRPRAVPKQNAVQKLNTPSKQIIPNHAAISKSTSTMKKSAVTKQNSQRNRAESKQSTHNFESKQANLHNEGAKRQEAIANLNKQGAFNVRVSKTSKKAQSKQNQLSSSKRKKATQNLKIIILHGVATPQSGTYFKKTSEASQRSKTSKTEESSKSSSKQARFQTGSKSGSFSESSNSTSARHREVDAAQKAAVTQTAGRTEILLTQHMDAQSRKSKSESYSRAESLSESYAGRVAASGAREALAAAAAGVADGSLTSGNAASQSISTASTSSEKSSTKYAREQESSISSTVEQVVSESAAAG